MPLYPVILADGPQEWWRLADPGGALCQNAGGGARRVLFSDSPLDTFPYSGPSSDGGSALHFPPNHITTGPTFVIPLGLAWTMEVWFWLPWNDSTFRGILALIQAAGVHEQVLYMQTTNCPGGAIAGAFSFNSAVVFAPAEWHQLAMTFDNITLKVYGDGSLLGSTLGVSASTGSYAVAVGTRGDGTSSTQGLFSEIAVFASSLTAGQLAAHYAAADQRLPPPGWRGGGSLSLPGGSGGSTFADQLAEASFVSKLYQNAP